MATPSQGFPKSEKLCSKTVMNKLFTSGSKKYVNGTVFYYLETTLQHDNDNNFAPKVVIVAKKKVFKKAVERNRIKRLFREAYRVQKQVLADYLAERKKTMALGFVYAGATMPGHDYCMQVVNCCIGTVIEKGI